MRTITFNRIKWALLPFWLIWCLPQNIVGFFVYLYCLFTGGCKRCVKDGIVWYSTKHKFGVSLGFWIFLNERSETIDIWHEFGHQIQSLMFGWLYLIVIGLPSGTSNIKWLNKLIRGRETNTYEQYYKGFWWERNADKLSGAYFLRWND